MPSVMVMMNGNNSNSLDHHYLAETSRVPSRMSGSIQQQQSRRSSISSSSSALLLSISTKTSANSSFSTLSKLSEENLKEHNNINSSSPIRNDSVNGSQSTNSNKGKVARKLNYSREDIVNVPRSHRSTSSTSYSEQDLNIQDDKETQRLKVERMVQSAIKKTSKTSSPQKQPSRIIYSIDKKYQLSDIEEDSEISSVSSGISSLDSSPGSRSQFRIIQAHPPQKLLYNFDESTIQSSSEQEEDEIVSDDLKILIPKIGQRGSSTVVASGDLSTEEVLLTSGSSNNGEEEEEQQDIYSMIEANKMLKTALDEATREKNSLEEQFVCQVEELEKFLTRNQIVKKGKTRRRSFSKHLSDEEFSNVNIALRTDIPKAEDSPIVKLSQSLLSTSPIKKIPELNITALSEKDSVITSLREKIEEIKYRYESERATESLRDVITNDISSILAKLSNDNDGSQTERTKDLTSSIKNFLTSSSLSASAIKQKEPPVITELKIQIEIQNEIIEKLKVDNHKMKHKAESERKSRKIISKELSQSEAYIVRLEEQMQKREFQHNEKLEIVTRAYDELMGENGELIQQVKFLRESLQESNPSNTNNSGYSPSNGSRSIISNMNKSGSQGFKLTSSNIISMISDSQSLCSDREPVKDEAVN